MGVWASRDDVLGRWVGNDRPTDLDLVDQLVLDAETAIVAVFPSIGDRITDDSLPVERVQLVVARMVTRAIRNPEGVRSRQEGTGPFSGSVTFGGDNPGELWLTDQERDLLSPNGYGRQQAFTISTIAPAPDPNDPPWWVTT